MTDNRTADNWHFAQPDLANDELDRLRAVIERLRFERDAARAELHQAYAEIGRLRTALRKVEEWGVASHWEGVMKIARAALDVGLPTAEDVRGILKEEP